MNHSAFGLLGIALIFFLAFLASENKKSINLRIVLACFALQVVIAVFVLYTPFGKGMLEFLSGKVTTLLSYADAGINMVFGGLASENVGFSFLVNVLPVIVFFAALMEVMYHLRIMQLIVKGGGRFLRWVTGTQPIESLNAVANIFIGQTESPLSLKPYLSGISKPQLFTIMVSGLASVAGTVMAGYISLGIRAEYLIAASFMAAPAGLMMAKIIMPDVPPVPVSNVDDETVMDSRTVATPGGDILSPETRETPAEDLDAEEIYTLGDKREHPNFIMAAAVGAQNGVMIAVNVGAMLLAFVALIALCNGILGYFGNLFGFENLSVQMILGWLFAPVMYLLNIPWSEAQLAGGVFGEKVILNEFVAYISLADMEDQFSERSYIILTFALCGFANISSIGILLGGLGVLVPERTKDIATMGFKAVYAASLANLMSAALAGILIGI